MPNDHGQTGTALTAAQQHAMRSREFNEQLDRQVRNFELMLPKHVTPEKFRRVVVTAVIQDKKLFAADRNSLFLAAQKCASDGLLPDGREAVLLPFNTKVKETQPDGTIRDVWKDLVTYVPMIAGIRQRMRNTGMVASAEAYVVHRNDKFFQKFGSDPQIVHEPPPLGTPRGDPVGAYAIIRLTSGEVIQEVMDKDEIERIRNFSKAKGGPAWTGHWGEMARKTVLRRAAKSAPTSAEMLTLLQRDDEEPAGPMMVDAEALEPEPPRAAAITHQSAAEPDQEPQYFVTDCDGEVWDFVSRDQAERALAGVFANAERRGPSHVDAARENNAALIEEIGEPPHSPPGPGNGADQPQNSGRDDVGGQSRPARGSTDSPPGDTDAYRIDLPDKPTSDDVNTFEGAILALVDAGSPLDVIRNNNAFNLARFEKLEPMRHNALMRKLGAK